MMLVLAVPLSRCSPPVPYDAPAPSLSAQSLRFDSSFECGNLLRAMQVGAREYDLVLRSDVGTRGHTQWFFFALWNTHAGEEDPAHDAPVHYRFNIVNMYKAHSLFSHGMRVVMLSMRAMAEHCQTWGRAGHDYRYAQNAYPRPGGRGERHYTLSFTLTFPRARDRYLVAFNRPYTLTDHARHMAALVASPSRKRCMRVSQVARSADAKRTTAPRRFRAPHCCLHDAEQLCTTLSGRSCDLITITDFTNERVPHGSTLLRADTRHRRRRPSRVPSADTIAKGRGAADSARVAGEGEPVSRRGTPVAHFRERRGVLLMARVHPGETTCSWTMKGVLDFLTSDDW